MLEGWIKSHRQLLNWQHFQEPIVLQVWIAILHSANSKDSWLRGRRIRRGEWVTSTAQIMAICGIGSNNTVIDALNTLEASGEIKRERFGNATKITVCHYSQFQGYADTAQPTAQPTAHKQEYKEGEERKEEKNINSLPHARAREIGIETFGSFANVFLFPAEHRTLSETYGQVLTDKAVDDLSCKLAEGDEQALNSRNHYATLDRWLRYKRETAKVPLSNSKADPMNEREKTLRIAWDATSEEGRQEYLDDHEGLLPWEYERKHQQT